MDGMPDIVFPFLFMRSIGANTPVRADLPKFLCRELSNFLPINLVTWARAEHLLDRRARSAGARAMSSPTNAAGWLGSAKREEKQRQVGEEAPIRTTRPRPRPRPRALGGIHFGRTRKLCKRQQLSVQHHYLPAVIDESDEASSTSGGGAAAAAAP